MAKMSKSMDGLIAELTKSVRGDLLNSLRPLIRQILEAAKDIESALARGASPRRRPGRPPKKRTVRKKAPSAKPRSRVKTKAPRGALKAVIEAALRRAGRPLKLTMIRDAALANAHFKGRDAMTLYRQVVRDIGQMTNVKKTKSGHYELHGSASGKAEKPSGRPAKNGRRKSARKKVARKKAA